MEIKVSFPLGKEVFSAMDLFVVPGRIEGFFEDVDISREFLLLR